MVTETKVSPKTSTKASPKKKAPAKKAPPKKKEPTTKAKSSDAIVIQIWNKEDVKYYPHGATATLIIPGVKYKEDNSDAVTGYATDKGNEAFYKSQDAIFAAMKTYLRGLKDPEADRMSRYGMSWVPVEIKARIRKMYKRLRLQVVSLYNLLYLVEFGCSESEEIVSRYIVEFNHTSCD